MLKAICSFIRRTAITALIAEIVCYVWQQIEIHMYGAVQYREVDKIAAAHSRLYS